MSLKAFHIFFILCAMFLLGWIGIWQLGIFGQTKPLQALLISAVFFAGAAGLAVYLLWFLKKMKKDNIK